MTREELEEGRRLLRAYLEESIDDFASNRDALHDWLRTSAHELLSLAEEARWRDVASETPESDAVALVWHVSLHASGTPISYAENMARFSRGRWSVYGVTHWRPLPKGPER